MATPRIPAYTSRMKDKSLAKTNLWIARDASKGMSLVHNIASSTAIKTGRSVEETSSRMLALRTVRQLQVNDEKKPYTEH